MIHVITAIELRVFIDYRFVPDLELAPHADLPLRNLAHAPLSPRPHCWSGHAARLFQSQYVKVLNCRAVDWRFNVV